MMYKNKEAIYMIVKLAQEKGGIVPRYATAGSAGCDVYSNAGYMLSPGETKIIHTGIYLEIPEGYEAQIRPRSGLAAKHGITVLNAPGTIDSDYRGEVMVILHNFGRSIFSVKPQERIAQIVFAPVCQAQFTITEKENLTQTQRQCGGLGSTGNK
jgi:dUTP pyrophosphatase